MFKPSDVRRRVASMPSRSGIRMSSTGITGGRSSGARRLQLRRAPVGLQPALELVRRLGDRDPDLLQRIAVAQRHGVVLHGLVVDGDAPWGSDLVLAPVALADRATGV